VSAAAPASILIRADAAADADVADELAAIAAAAIASGAVALPGVAAGISANAIGTGIATATAFGVVAEGSPCCAGTAGAVEGSAAEAWSAEDFAAGSKTLAFKTPAFKTPAFEALDFALDRRTASASALLSALVVESRLAVASRSSEFFCAAWSATVASRDRVLSAAVADASSERRCDADCCWAVEVPRLPLLLVSADVLPSTSAPKLSFPDGWSGRAGLCGGGV
jgi:hypothetical protein